MSPSQATSTARLYEVAWYFLKLGTTAFGGPAAHIAMMRSEAVDRRKWLTEQEFLDLLGATNLIPGPNSTEMAIHIGYLRAGWRGLLAAGVLFILPAMLIVLALAAIYRQYGAGPESRWLLYGIQPVIIGIILQALWALSRTALKTPLLTAITLATAGLYLAGVMPLVLLLGGGLIALSPWLGTWPRPRARGIIIAVHHLSIPRLGMIVTAAAASSLATLFLTFLKIGAILYGSGYVLLAFLHDDFVVRLGWLTDRQLLDAITVGQVTPGPVFTTATWIGYLVGGIPGAILATLGIFLPSFVFVAGLAPFVRRIQQVHVLRLALDGVNAAAVGLMAGVTWQLARAALSDWLTLCMAITATILLPRLKVNSVWLIAAGAAIGVGYHLMIRGT
ncbi:MAG: chromate efflux transporter [Herpetosiphon sp.]